MDAQSFDIFDVIPRDYEMLPRADQPKPKPKARIDPIFADLSEWTKRAVRVHYPERVHELIKDDNG